MKKLLSVIVMGIAGFAFVNANTMATTVEAPTHVEAQQQEAKRTLVQHSDLPEAIQTALRGDDHTGWTVATAYLVEQEGQEAYYEVSLRKEGEEDLRVVQFKADGTAK